jgi:hypothetical protein
VKSESEPRKGLDQFTKDVLYSALVGVTSKVLGWAALLMVGLGVALIAAGWKVPAWTLVAMLFLGLVLIYATKRAAAREARELRPKVARAEDQLDRHESYGSNLCSVLDTFQKIVAKDIQLPMSTFIERGILTPARDVMQENGHPADLRMSVLLESEGHFSMVWASGHSIESQKKFKVLVEKTISQVAYEKQAIQVWKNAPEEERSFVENPKATRGFKSMVSIPISKGDSTHGVFNVVTDAEDCFDPADINYLTSLGAIIQLAFGLALTEIQVQREAKAQQGQVGRPMSAKLAARAAKALNSAPAPGENVGSSDTADGTEASDG